MALKNLWSHKSRMILTVVGVAIGVSAIIFLVSLGYGLEKLVTQQVASFNAFSVIDIPSSGSKSQKIDDQLMQKINDLGHVKYLTPVCNIAGRVKKIEGDSTAETVIIAGDDNYWDLAEITAKDGSLPGKENEVAINGPVIKMIGEDKDKIIGKNIDLNLLIPEEMLKEDEPEGKVVESKNLKVVGIYQNDTSPVILTQLNLLTGNGVTNYSSLKVQVDNPDNVEQVREQIESLGFTTEFVGDTLNEISRVFSLFRVVLAGFGLIALIVAALGTFNTLTVSLMEKTKEVGLFKSLGMRNKDIYQLFLAEALIIGILGGICGLIIGGATSQGINMIIAILARRQNAEVIEIFSTPVVFSLLVALFSVAVSFLTGWYPSRRAVKINPLDAMRYE